LENENKNLAAGQKPQAYPHLSIATLRFLPQALALETLAASPLKKMYCVVSASIHPAVEGVFADHEKRDWFRMRTNKISGQNTGYV